VNRIDENLKRKKKKKTEKRKKERKEEKKTEKEKKKKRRTLKYTSGISSVCFSFYKKAYKPLLKLSTKIIGTFLHRLV